MAEAVAKTSIKPYKLKPSGDALTRDDLSTWREVLLSFMRQNEKWRPFLPGATDPNRSTWTSADDGGNNAWPAEVTRDFDDFLTCLATFAPTGCGETIKRESISFNWAIDLIKETFGLKTRGEHFLALDDIKFEFGPNYTYQQAYMEIKDFICAGLLKNGDRFENKVLAANETLSPVAKNFITKEWLLKIDPRLPKHIQNTRGHLFTEDKPTLSCNQKTIADQIPTMLAELDGAAKADTVDSGSGDNVNIGYVPSNRRGPRAGRGIVRAAGYRGYQPRPRALAPQLRPPSQVPPGRMSGCMRCLEAIPTRYDAARTHATRDCPWPPNPGSQQSRPRPNFRVVLVPEDNSHGYEVDATESYYNQEQFFNPDAYENGDFEDVTHVYDNKDTPFYSCPLNSNQNFKVQAMTIRKVQTLSVKVNDENEVLTLDSGAEGNIVSAQTCDKLGLPVLPLDGDDRSIPTQADGRSPLDVIGQTEFSAVRGKVELHFKGYVAQTLSANILCGRPFLEENKVVQELHNHRVVIDGKYTFLEDSPLRPDNPSMNTVADTSDPKVNIQLIQIEDTVPKEVREKLIAIHVKHKNVFNGDLSGGYNGASGNFDVNFNFKGGIPPTPNYDSVPSYFSNQDRILLQAKIDDLEKKGICVKVADTNIVPKYAAPCMLVKKHSARDLKPGEYDQLSTEDKLKYNRFILCHNKLSEQVEKQPAKMNRIDDTIRMVGSFKYVITSDLSDSFWQRHVSKDKLPYFAFHSPFRGAYIFLRSTQGLINQSEGLEELVSVILQDCIMSGWCWVIADNLYVMGHNYEETVKHWKIVLDLLASNNIKLSPKKTACFPKKLDLLGWTKEGKFLVPDPHRQNAVANAPLPVTVKNLRSYLGAYRTFFRCKKDMSNILKELEELQAGKISSEKLKWSKDLIEKFEISKKRIAELDKLYLPKQEDQLIMTSDWSEKGISCTLWAIVDNVPNVVTRFSAKIVKSMENLLNSGVKPKTLPCDGEMTAVYVGIKSPVISSYIRASNKRTVCLVDNKPVVEAAKLIKDGKFSSSRVINNLMTAISDYNLEFQHLSSKMGQNVIDDYGSRNPVKCNSDPESCKICSFIKDCDQLTIAPLSFTVSDDDHVLIGTLTHSENLVQDILLGKQSVPFSNRKAMKFLQDKDPDLIKVREYLTTGKRPTPRNTKENKVKRFLQKADKMTIAKDGCLVITKRDGSFNNRELIVIPDDISVGLLYAMHINLNHPTSYQLSKLLDTRFYLLDKETKVKQITESCTLCCSVAKIPKEIETFKPNDMPNHPGNAFTIDILKMDKKNIIVAVENFSGFLSTAFINSEKSSDLIDGILLTTSPFRTSVSTDINIRVDQAPGFKSIMKEKKALKKLNINLELGHAKNKNAVAIVDKKIKELEDEIKKIKTGSKIIDIRILSKATGCVNEKIRHQGLSAREILFSRDQFSQANLQLDDSVIAEDKMKKREQSNKYSAKSKAQVKTEAIPANAKKGQVVLMKHEVSKHSKREVYIVLDTDETTKTLVIAKLPHALSGSLPITFQPHNASYIVKQTDIVLSPDQPSIYFEHHLEHVSDEILDEPKPKEKKKVTKPYYPYEDDDDDFEYFVQRHEDNDNNNDDVSSDNFDSFSEDNDADDENTGDNANLQEGSDSEDALEENINARELEISNLVEEEDEEEDNFLDEEVVDQSRLPKKNDIIKYIRGDYWIMAKVLSRARGNWFNLLHEDGTKGGVTLNLPTAEFSEGWSLLPSDVWQQEELRVTLEYESREPSPIPHDNLDVQEENSPQPQQPSLQLSLTPDEEIQFGQVYFLPETKSVTIQLPNHPAHDFTIDQDEYERRYQKFVKTLNLPPEQKHAEHGLVNYLIHDEIYKEQNGPFSKLKKIFKKGRS